MTAAEFPLTGVGLAGFARYLNHKGYDFDDIVYMLEKPWKYTTEWKHFQACETWREDNTCSHEVTA